MPKIVAVRSTLLLCLLVLPCLANAQDAWTAYMQPGDAHGFIGQFAGEWEEEVNMWMQPGEDPQVFKVDCTLEMVLGGRFLEFRRKGEMAGMPFEAVGHLGFNNASKMFTLTSLSNFGTGMMVLTGQWIGDKRDIKLTGELTNPLDNQPVYVRQVISFIDINTIVIENFDRIGDGDERKTAQYVFRRRPG